MKTTSEVTPVNLTNPMWDFNEEESASALDSTNFPQGDGILS